MNRLEIEEILPLSPLQQGLLFHAICGDSDDYLTQIGLRLEGPLDAGVLRAAGDALVERHPALRSAILHEGLSTPVQVVAAQSSPCWRRITVSGTDAAERERTLGRICAEERSSRFELTRPPLIKFALARMGPERHQLIITVHHIILDGWSTPLLVQELFAHYAAGGRSAELPAVAPYRDFFAWLAGQDTAASRKAWREALAGGVEPSLLAAWAPALGPAGDFAHTVELPSTVTTGLVQTARTTGVTLGTVVQGAWAVLLAHLLHRDDVVFGTTTALRPADISGIERVIGPLINTTPVRARVDHHEPVTDLLRRLHDEQALLFSHRHLSLAEIQRQAGSGELFDTLVVFDSYPAKNSFTVTDRLGVADIEMNGAPHYPLTVIVTAGERLRLQFLVKPSQLGDVAEHIVGRLTRLLEAIAADPHRLVGTIQLSGPDELGSRAYVRDGARRPVPPGCVGDLYLPSDGPGAVADPLGPGLMQPTRALARLCPDGAIRVLGHADAVPRIGGRWVVLEEVEEVLRERPEVYAAAAAVHEVYPGDRRLIAYVVARGAINARAIRRQVAARLPAHCVPVAVVALDALPLTAAGTPDRSLLVVPDFGSRPTAELPTPREQALCRLFAKVLGLTDVGIDDNFFDLAGHSLAATRLVSLIRAELGLELEIWAVFESPTPAGLADRLEEAIPVISPDLVDFVEPPRPVLTRRPRPETVPPSFVQRRLWFLSQFDGPSSTYNIPIVLELTGGVDGDALRAAVDDVVARHEVLRTVLPDIDGEPQQVILDPGQCQVRWSVQDVTEGGLPRALETAAAHKFQLESELPLRVTLFRTAPDRHVLLMLLHHVAGDEWSLQPLVEDLGTAYSARRDGAPPRWTPLPVQYADYVLWQRDLLGDAADPDSMFARQLVYWRGTLAGLPHELTLPYDRSRPEVATGRGGSVPLALGQELVRAIATLASDCRATPFMVLHAGVAALLSRLGAGTDIVLGAPIAGRTDENLEDLVGCFVNTLVLRVDTSGNPTFRALIERTRAVDLAAYAHQDAPFEAVVEALNPPRIPGRNPLFQVVLTLENTGVAELKVPGLDARVHADVALGRAQFDLAITLVENSSGEWVDGTLEYATDLFDHATAALLADRLVSLFECLVVDPAAPIGAAEITSPAVAATVPTEAAAGLSGGTTLPELFETVVTASPNAVAVTDTAGDLSYIELDARADELARALNARGIGAEDLVAIFLERGAELVVAILGVLKAGAAYLPIDPSYPAERIGFMVDDAAPRLVITDMTLAAGLPPSTPTLALGLPDHDMASAGERVGPVESCRMRSLRPANPAYVIYTSGSTGTPKGVVVSHQSVVRLFTATENCFQFGATDVWTLFHSYAFDFSVWELWGALLYGGRLVVVPYEVSRSPGEFLRLLRAEKVTVLNQTPSAFGQLMASDEEDPETGAGLALRMIVFGGEALQPAHLRSWFERHDEQRTKLVNMYGTTETTVHASRYELSASDTFSPGILYGHVVGCPIGTALDDLRIRVLDARFRPAPLDVAGEVYVSGPGLARGYLNRPGVTAERFIADPDGTGERMYRTGDLAKLRRDGVLDYVGRADDQVKIRGFRVELGEVRHVLAEHPSVSQAVVTVREDRVGDRRLIGYVVPAHDVEASPTVLREHLRQQLPDHMVPATLMLLKAIPLTPNGKVDLRALPAPSYNSATGLRPVAAAHEQVLVGLFADVLGLRSVGVDDSFFELGGHSLLATRLASRVRTMLGVDVPIQTLFQYPTAGSLAQWLRGRAASGEVNALGPILALRARGAAPALWCVHPVGGMSWAYSGLLPYIEVGQPVYGLQARGLSSDEELPRSVEEMADDYVARITAVAPVGPYHLLGWSLGGVVAQAMAARLERRGHTVALLTLLDSDLYLSPEDPTEDMLAATLSEAQRSVAGVADADPVLTRRLARIVDNNARLIYRFTPEPVACDTLIFTAAGSSPENMWPPYLTGAVEIHRIAAGHYDLLCPESLGQIGPILAARLAATTGPA